MPSYDKQDVVLKEYRGYFNGLISPQEVEYGSELFLIDTGEAILQSGLFSFPSMPSGNSIPDYADILINGDTDPPPEWSLAYQIATGIPDKIEYWENFEDLIALEQSFWDSVFKFTVLDFNGGVVPLNSRPDIADPFGPYADEYQGWNTEPRQIFPHPYKALLILKDNQAEVFIDGWQATLDVLEAFQEKLQDGEPTHFLAQRDLSEWEVKCIEDRVEQSVYQPLQKTLRPFIRPVDTYPKENPDDFRIQDSYLHHKTQWEGWDAEAPVEILFLSRAKESENKFSKYNEYTPNINGYFDSLFKKPPAFDYLIDGNAGDGDNTIA